MVIQYYFLGTDMRHCGAFTLYEKTRFVLYFTLSIQVLHKCKFRFTNNPMYIFRKRCHLHTKDAVLK